MTRQSPDGVIFKFHNQHVADLADRIVATRDFCGNEREAILDYLADEGFTIGTGRSVREAAVRRANAIWAASQRAAGVSKPISAGERASIHRMMEVGS